MTRAYAPSERPDDDDIPPGVPGSSKLRLVLVGWLLLSAFAVVGALVLHRGPQHPVSQQAAGSNPLSSDLGLGSSAANQLPPASGSSGWRVHLLYTVQEGLHDLGPSIPVTGCANPKCTGKRVMLGVFPAPFVQAVKVHGTGFICYGPLINHYLNWDSQVGYWLDTAPGAFGMPAYRKYRTASSNSPLLPIGTHIQIAVCGPAPQQGAAELCSRLRKKGWNVVASQLTKPGRDVWIYVGKEIGPSVATKPWVSIFRHATLRIG